MTLSTPRPSIASHPLTLPTVTFAAVCVATLAVLAGRHADVVLATVVFDGLVPLANVAAATLAGIAVVRRVAPEINRLLLVASGAGVGLGLLVTGSLALGLAGLLNVITGWGLVALLGVLGVVDLRRTLALFAAQRGRSELADSSRLSTWTWLLAAPALGVALVAATVPPGLLWGDEPNGYDVTSYHLQVPREWHDAGRITPLDHNVFSHMPLGQETLVLLQMHQLGGPHAAMYAAQITSVLLTILAALAVAGAVRGDDGSNALAVALAGVLTATLPWTTVLAGIAYNEPHLLLASALTAAFLIRTLTAEQPWRPALLAGLFAGLGVAAKLTAAPMLVVAGGGATLLVMLVARRPKAALTATVAFAGGSLVFSLPWLVKEAVWTGNPVFPLATGLFGDGGWSAEQIERWRRAHALAADQSRFARLFGELLWSGAYGWIFWPAAFVAGAATMIVRRDGRAGLLLIWLFAMLTVWLAATHLQGRFFVAAVPAGATLIGLAFSHLRGTTLKVATIAVAVLSLGWTANVGVRLAGRLPAFDDPSVTLLGQRSLSFLTPPDLPTDLTNRTVYLVGDARAFNYESGDVHYKGVFDVPPADGALAAWLGDALQTAPDDALVVIAPSEVARLSRTYRTPPLEVELPADHTTVTLTMRQVRSLLDER